MACALKLSSIFKIGHFFKTRASLEAESSSKKCRKEDFESSDTEEDITSYLELEGVFKRKYTILFQLDCELCEYVNFMLPINPLTQNSDLTASLQAKRFKK